MEWNYFWKFYSILDIKEVYFHWYYVNNCTYVWCGVSFIWIWKYVEIYSNNVFEKHLSCFLKHNFLELKHGIIGTS
jgi:hypothetical protein